MAYTHFSTTQKDCLEYALSLVHRQSIRSIARSFNKEVSSILREIKRNLDENGKYNSGLAKKRTRERIIQAHSKCRKIEHNQSIEIYILYYIRSFEIKLIP